MLKLSNVLKHDHPLTRQEQTIIDTLILAAVFAFWLIVILVYIGVTEGLQELISVFMTVNAVSVCLLLFVCLAVHQFLYVCRYIRRFNRAVQNGERHHGVVVEKRMYSLGARQGVRYRFAVQLENGRTVKTPVYTDLDVPFNQCDVYLYKKKYYFSDFQWVTCDGRDIRPAHIKELAANDQRNHGT